jgi:hypothetical protein
MECRLELGRPHQVEENERTDLTARTDREAKADWRTGRFDTVPGDAEEFMPLPDAEKVASYPSLHTVERHDRHRCHHGDAGQIAHKCVIFESQSVRC